VTAGRLAGSVIFTCDEFGESHSANVDVIEAMERGLGGAVSRRRHAPDAGWQGCPRG